MRTSLLLGLAYLAVGVHVPKNLGYAALGGLIAVETMGIPMPGESALIVAGILASDGHLQIELVILVAAAGAGIGALVGAPLALAIVGVFVGFGLGFRLVYWRFKDI